MILRNIRISKKLLKIHIDWNHPNEHHQKNQYMIDNITEFDVAKELDFFRGDKAGNHPLVNLIMNYFSISYFFFVNRWFLRVILPHIIRKDVLC